MPVNPQMSSEGVGSPAGTGTVNVTVTTPEGTSATSTADHFTFLAPPTATKAPPSSGSTAGGTTVTITGTRFATPASVWRLRPASSSAADLSEPQPLGAEVTAARRY